MRLADSALGARLKELDAECAAGTTLDRGKMFAFLFSDLALERNDLLEDPEPDLRIQKFIREESAPLFPSKKDLARRRKRLVDAGMRTWYGSRINDTTLCDHV